MSPTARTWRLSVGWWIALAALTTACSEKITAPPEPPGSVRRGDEAFRYQEYDAAVADYRPYLDQVEHGEYTARTFYKTALAQYRLKHYRECLTTLDELGQRYPNGHWVQVEALRGDAERELGHPTVALQAWDGALKWGNEADRPKLRQRIVSVARQLSDVELARARRLITTAEVGQILDQQMALRQPPPLNEPVPEAETGEEHLAEQPPPAAAEPVSAPDVIAEAPPEAAVAEPPALADRPEEPEAQQPPAVPAPPEEPPTEPAAAAPEESAPPQVEAEAPPPVEAEAPPPENEPVEPPLLSEPGAVQPEAAPEGAVAALPDDARGSEEAAGATEAQVVGTAKVVCLLPFTGADRTLSERALRGVRLVFGKGSANLTVQDTGGSPASAAELVDRLARDPDVLVVIGPPESDIAAAMASRAESARLPLLLLSPSDALGGQYVLPTGVSRVRQVRALVDYAVNKIRLRRFGVLYPKDASGKAFLAEFRTEADRRGGTVVGADAYTPGDISLPAELGTVKKWRQGHDLQAVFLPDGAVAAGRIAHALQQEMPDITLLGVHAWESLGGEEGVLNGVLFADGFHAGSSRSAVRDFERKFQQAYGETPGTVEAEAYDTASLARRVLDAGVHSRSEFMQRLVGLGPVDGATGELQITPDGFQRQLYLLQVYDGKLQEVGNGRPG